MLGKQKASIRAFSVEIKRQKRPNLVVELLQDLSKTSPDRVFRISLVGVLICEHLGLALTEVVNSTQEGRVHLEKEH